MKPALNLLLILLSCSNAFYAQKSDCKYIVNYYENGTKKEEGCLTNGKKEGQWKEYYASGYVYESIYKNNAKNGPYTMYYPTGEIRSKGFYKNNASVDTLMTFTKKGDMICKCFLVAKAGTESKVTWKKFYDPNAKPDGTLETKDGKNYMWQLGELTEFKLKK